MNAQTTTHHSAIPTLPIKTPKQLVTVLVLAFVVPVVLIILLAKVVVSMRAPDPAVLAPEAVAARIKPVADVAIQAGEKSGEAAAAGAATSPAAGKAVYDRACVACHQAGVAGAPKFGDKALWAPRISQGMDALYTSSIKGKGAMPPKGGQTALVDAEIKAAVDYMVAAAK